VGASLRKYVFAVLLITLCLAQSGCSLLQLPGQIIGGAFDLAGKALQVADSLPKPPPWMFF